MILCEETQVTALAAAAQGIAAATKNKDFKYKHVQKSAEARAAFLRAVNSLNQPCGLFGFYAAGGALLNEKDCAVEEMALLGVDDGGHTAEYAERIRREEGNAHIEAFLSYFASCLLQYARAVRREVKVCWDRRSDLAALQQHCEDYKEVLGQFAAVGAATSLVTFQHVADGPLTSVARLAGVVVGDVRYFFQKHGDRSWSRLPAAVRVAGQPDESVLNDPRKLAEVTRVETVEEPLADADFAQAGKDTCMLQGYWKRFIEKLISFASPPREHGTSGHHPRVEVGDPPDPSLRPNHRGRTVRPLPLSCPGTV